MEMRIEWFEAGWMWIADQERLQGEKRYSEEYNSVWTRGEQLKW
jgi:hypothetical protein